MAKYTYGQIVLDRTLRIFEALFDYANIDSDDRRNVQWKGELKIYFDTDKKGLQKICGKNPSAKPDEKQKEYENGIRPALSYYLSEFLGILEDKRSTRKGEGQGSDIWKFDLNLWSNDKQENIRRFREEWERNKNSIDLSLSINKSSTSVSSEEEFSRELTKIIKSQGILFTNLSNIQALLSRSWDLPSAEIVKEVLMTLYPGIEISNFRSNSTETQIQDNNDINLDLVCLIAEKIIEFRSEQKREIISNE